MDRGLIVSRILLIDGILLIVAAFVHLLSSPPIQLWLSRSLSPESLTDIPLNLVLNHLSVGILLIPFGMSTMYTAAGVRARYKWAVITALANGIGVLALPILPLLLTGPEYFFSETTFLLASLLNTIVGISIVISIAWLMGGQKQRRPA